MTALAGTKDEWIEIEPGAWARYVVMPKSPWGAREWSEEDGIVFLGAMSFDEYWEKRATATPEPAPDPLADLEARLAKLEAGSKEALSLRD